MCGRDQKWRHQSFAPMGSCSSVDPHFSATGCVFRHENTRRWTVGCYGDFEKFVCISTYCVSALSHPYNYSYRLYDTILWKYYSNNGMEEVVYIVTVDMSLSLNSTYNKLGYVCCIVGFRSNCYNVIGFCWSSTMVLTKKLAVLVQ